MFVFEIETDQNSWKMDLEASIQKRMPIKQTNSIILVI